MLTARILIILIPLWFEWVGLVKLGVNRVIDRPLLCRIVMHFGSSPPFSSRDESKTEEGGGERERGIEMFIS